jgi:GDPmannose 4,6-dehydratase
MSRPTSIITGVTGQCGSYLAELLLEKGHRVIGVKRRTSLICTDRVDHLLANPRFSLEYGDLCDSYSLMSIFERHRPDYVYNAGAMSHVRVSFEIPENTIDVVGTGVLRLLNAVRQTCPDARVVQFSSSEMFGDNPVYPQHEETRLSPASPYACAKVLAHNLCRNYRESYGLHVVCPIMFNCESPRRGETFVTRKITQAAARIKLGKQEKLFLGNLEAKRDWGYAKEYMQVVIRLLELERPPDDYVIGTGETHSVQEFLDEVFSLAGLDVSKHVGTDPRLFRPHEVPHLEADATKVRRLLDWTPSYTMRDLARLMFESDLTEETHRR